MRVLGEMTFHVSAAGWLRSPLDQFRAGSLADASGRGPGDGGLPGAVLHCMNLAHPVLAGGGDTGLFDWTSREPVGGQSLNILFTSKFKRPQRNDDRFR